MSVAVAIDVLMGFQVFRAPVYCGFRFYGRGLDPNPSLSSKPYANAGREHEIREREVLTSPGGLEDLSARGFGAPALHSGPRAAKALSSAGLAASVCL